MNKESAIVREASKPLKDPLPASLKLVLTLMPREMSLGAVCVKQNSKATNQVSPAKRSSAMSKMLQETMKEYADASPVLRDMKPLTIYVFRIIAKILMPREMKREIIDVKEVSKFLRH
jgi:hypothetical protein